MTGCTCAGWWISIFATRKITSGWATLSSSVNRSTTRYFPHEVWIHLVLCVALPLLQLLLLHVVGVQLAQMINTDSNFSSSLCGACSTRDSCLQQRIWTRPLNISQTLARHGLLFCLKILFQINLFAPASLIRSVWSSYTFGKCSNLSSVSSRMTYLSIFKIEVGPRLQTNRYEIGGRRLERSKENCLTRVPSSSWLVYVTYTRFLGSS